MPTWGEILKEIQAYLEQEKKPPFDYIRRKYLLALQQHTNRNTILYATSWTQPKNIPTPSHLISITDEDIQGFMEVVSGLRSKELDIIIHSTGGSAEATEALVSYLRSKFDNIRVIIPYGAMSAATMLACSTNDIIMGAHSFIGPIDPQMIVNTRLGLQAIPAQAIIDQFEKAKQECINPNNLGVWIPILEQYGPALIVQCENAIELSKILVTDWLEKYLFASEENAKSKSEETAKKLADHSLFKTHSRHIGRDHARELGLRIVDLENDQILQDKVLSVFHATTFTFDATAATKIIENHLGKAYIKQSQQITVVTKQPTEEIQKGTQ